MKRTRLADERMLDMAAMKELLSKVRAFRHRFGKCPTGEARGCRASEGPSRAVGAAGVRDCRGRTARWFATARSARRARLCAVGCGIWPMRGAGSATGGASSCSGAKARCWGSNRIYRLYREE